MVRWLPWKRGPNYEYELPRLAAEIRELKLKDISAATRHKRWPAAFVQHSLSVVVLYAAYALLFASRKRKHLTILAFVPLILIAGYKLISRVTLWHETRIKSTLKLIEERRQTLVSAYKKQVKFDELMSLIGEDSLKPSPKSTSSKPANQKSTTPKPPKSQSTPKSRKPASKGTSNSQDPPSAYLDGPVPVYQTTWVDRILDLVIGVNENSPAFRYALICPYCHAHNGLAPYGKLAEDISYHCRVCNRLVGESQDVSWESIQEPKTPPPVDSPLTQRRENEKTHREKTTIDSEESKQSQGSKESSNSAEESSNSAEEPSNSAEEPSNSAEEPSNSAEKPSNSAEKPSNSAEKPKDTTEDSSNFNEESTNDTIEESAKNGATNLVP